MSPKVSILMSTYNRPKYLRQAIGSILAQTFEDWELILVEDVNVPGLYAADRELVEFEKRILCFSSDLPDHDSDRSPGIDKEGRNRYCHNINLAFKSSQGELLTYLCDDDLYMPTRLGFMVQMFDDYPDVKMVYGKQQLLYENPDGSIQLDKKDRWSGKIVHNGGGLIDHSSFMHRRECFEKAGGWDESAPARFGDLYFFRRLDEAGYMFHGIGEVLDIHRYHENTVTRAEEKVLELVPTQ